MFPQAAIRHSAPATGQLPLDLSSIVRDDVPYKPCSPSDIAAIRPATEERFRSDG
jgi:hypothetical protein